MKMAFFIFILNEIMDIGDELGMGMIVFRCFMDV